MISLRRISLPNIPLSDHPISINLTVDCSCSHSSVTQTHSTFTNPVCISLNISQRSQSTDNSSEVCQAVPVLSHSTQGVSVSGESLSSPSISSDERLHSELRPASSYSQNLGDSKSLSNLSEVGDRDVVNDPAFCEEEENAPEIVIHAPRSYKPCTRFYNQSIKSRLTLYLDQALKSYFVTLIVITLCDDRNSVIEHDLPCVMILCNPNLDPLPTISNSPNELFDSDNGENCVCITAEGDFQSSNSDKRNRKYI